MGAAYFTTVGIPLREGREFTPADVAGQHAGGYRHRNVCPAADVIADVRRVVASIDKTVTVFRAQTMQDQIEQQTGVERLLATLGTFFAAMAALMAALGLYGVTAYVASARTREFGIRMALGATSPSIVHSMMNEAVPVVIAGLLIGVVVATIAGAVRRLLYEIEPLDPTMIVSAAGLLIIVTGIAAFVPARRAARIDPVSALQ